MKITKFILLLLTLLANGCKGQPAFGLRALQLEKEISLPNVHGRIDHMDVNAKAGILYVAALGNNTLEVIDLRRGERIRSISGLDEPQGVGYIPETDEVVVANGGNGDCYFYNAKTFEKLATVHLSSDADDVRYDPAEQKLYVGYGSGGIAVIDAATHKQIGDIKLPAHPEGFQLDRTLGRLFVNVPEVHMIGVVDLKTGKLASRWGTSNLKANFPMAIDPVNRQLFIGYRHPAALVAVNALSGATISSSAMIGDVDDLYYNFNTLRVYVSGGGGAIDVFEQNEKGFRQISHIPTRSGARTSLLIPSLHLFVLAERTEGARQAQVTVYSTQ